MVLLMILIYVVNWELNFGKFHYWIKQTLTAVGIRYLIETFPLAGPAINVQHGISLPMEASLIIIFITLFIGYLPLAVQYSRVSCMSSMLEVLYLGRNYQLVPSKKQRLNRRRRNRCLL